MTRVLVTGATGFIGAPLCRELLARGRAVAALVRPSSKVDRLREIGVELAPGDVTDPQSVRRAVAGRDLVFHVAGCLKALDAAAFDRVNREGTRNVVAACAEQSAPPRVLLVSSLAAVGPSPDGKPLVEHCPARPISHYGRSKRAGEVAAAALADRVPITVVRPGAVFGPGDPATLEIFRPIARWGVHMVPVRPKLGVSMIHLDDLIALILLAAERGAMIRPESGADAACDAGYYFAACDEYPMYDELGRMMAWALGRRRVACVPAPRRLVRAAGMFQELVGRVLGRPLSFNLDKAREATAGCWFCSPRKAAAELGFAPAAPLLDRLRQTAEWYRNAGWV